METIADIMVKQAERLDDLVFLAEKNPREAAEKLVAQMMDENKRIECFADIEILVITKPAILAKIFRHGIRINHEFSGAMAEIFVAICLVDYNFALKIFREAMFSDCDDAQVAAAMCVGTLAKRNPKLGLKLCKEVFSENTFQAEKVILLSFDCLAHSSLFLLFEFYRALVLSDNPVLTAHMIQVVNFLFCACFNEAFFVMTQALKDKEKMVRYHMGLSLSAIICHRPATASQIFEEVFASTYDIQISFHLMLIEIEANKTTSQWISEFYQDYPEIKKQRDLIIPIG
jgi:hypothetical protein